MHSGKPKNWDSAILYSGILYVLVKLFLFFSVFFTTVLKKPGGFDGDIAGEFKYYQTHAVQWLFGNYLIVLHVPFFLFFIGGFYYLLSRIDKNSPLSAIVMTSGTAMAMTWPLGAVLSSLSVSIAGVNGDPATAHVFGDMPPYTLALSSLARVVMLAATSLFILHSGIASRVMARMGILLSILSFFGSMVLFSYVFIPVLLFTSVAADVWLLLLCRKLLRSKKECDYKFIPVFERTHQANAM
jgi:hypothetical protein